MIPNITLLLLFQLAGEIASRALALTLPGPVLGMAGLMLLFLARPAIATRMLATTGALMSHLSLLFVPAGVGVLAHAELLERAGPALLIAVALSTVLALIAGSLTFVLLARLTDANETPR